MLDQLTDELTNFYCGHGDGEPNLFEIWEGGGARGDSVTPSTHSRAYRRWMHRLLVSVLDRHDPAGLLSLGSGNAVIERLVHQDGYPVLAVDAMPAAVELARAKGIDAVCADLGTWTPERAWPVVYMDGVLGHVYDESDGLRPTLCRVRSWLESNRSGRGTLVASNDSTRDGSHAQRAPGVAKFCWLSPEYLRAQAVAAGFTGVEAQTFVYQRPISGDRVRSVIVAHVGGE